METYRDLYKWMVLPLIIMQAGIFPSYWADFLDNTWAVHVHYWTGTIWYVYLILQPYYATHGQLEKHRTNGIIGMFLAGGVCLTALSMMHRDLVVAQLSAENPDQFGPLQPWFFFGVMAVEIPMIIAFGYAVIQSIIKRKKVHDHAWWLVSTIFIIMMPALGRGIQGIDLAIHRNDWPNIAVMPPIYLTEIIIITLLLLMAWKYKKVKHPATYLAVAINLFNCFLEPLGRSEPLQQFFTAVIKG